MSTSSADQKLTNLSSPAPFILIFFLSMVVHEIALESITAIYSLPPYNIPHLASSITLFQFGFCVLLPLSLSLLSSNGDVVRNFPRTRGEFKIYVLLSVVVYGATALATMSLEYEGVTYVTKVVFKSAKLIPTMIVGVILDARAVRQGNIVKNRKKYGIWEYASALFLSVGAAGFCMKNPNDDSQSNAETEDVTETSSNGVMGSHLVGLSMLTASVFCDALVPNIQEKLMHGNATETASTPNQNSDNDVEMKSLIDNKQNISQSTSKGLSFLSLMVNTNAIGFTLLLLSTILSSSILSIKKNILSHPRFFFLLLTVGIGLGTAVLAYTELIRRSGSAVAVAVATLRKVVTVVLSYVIFPKVMSWTHAISCGYVLVGLVIGFVGRGKK